MKQAKKLSKDEISLETIYYTKKVSGSPVVASKTKVFRNQIETELTTLSNGIDYWQQVNAQEFINEKIQDLQKQKIKWDKMKQAIDGNINDTIVIED